MHTIKQEWKIMKLNKEEKLVKNEICHSIRNLSKIINIGFSWGYLIYK
ncbi:hypothetical protein CNEO4_200103 [Clostridium neonatale]|nr:hypothetical protein CNEO4_200103 [Clostridium neonatale]